MFFPKLEVLSQKDEYKTLSQIIDSLDTWLAILPKSYRNSIIPEMFSRDEEVNISIVYKIFNKLTDLNLLQERYLIRCPRCSHVVVTLDNIDEVINYIREYNDYELECDFCEKNKKLTTKNVFSIYKLIEEPKGDLDSIKKLMLIN